MRVLLAISALLVGCGGTPSADAAQGSPSTAPAPRETAAAAACAPTTSRDAAGAITANGTFGVVGDTSTPSATAMNEPLLVVRRGAVAGDRLDLRFVQLAQSAPATWVEYGVQARTHPSPWGEVTFEAGWKPIGFAGSCWRVLADGADTGLVLEVRP